MCKRANFRHWCAEKQDVTRNFDQISVTWLVYEIIIKNRSIAKGTNQDNIR